MTPRRAPARSLLAVTVALLLLACGETPPDDLADSGPADPGEAAQARRIGNLEVRGVPEIPQELIDRQQQYRSAREARFQGWLGDGVLISTRFGDTEQLHRLQRPGAARRQITFFDEPVYDARVPGVARPEGFVYARDSGGSEFFQLYWFDLASASSRLLTDGRSRYTEVVWSSAGDRFAYTTTERNGRDWDIHVQDLEGNVQVALQSDGDAWIVQDFAPDDDALLLLRYVSINESYVYELDLESGALAPLLERDGPVAVRQARYAPDGRSIFYTADRDAEFLRLNALDRQTGAITVLTAGIEWDVEAFDVCPDGGHLAFTVNEGGFSKLHVWRLPDRTPMALPQMRSGIIGDLQFHPAGDRIGFSLRLATAPSDVYSIDLDSGTLSRWTESEVGGLDPDGFAEPELIDFPTFDQVDGHPRRIPALVFRPRGEGPHPVYVTIHGGPESQFRPYFSPSLQYYVRELGMAVVAPNVRGSAGYGKSYLKLDDGRRREDAVRDIGALLDWITTQPDLDADRIVVSGGSYGGYMVLASLVHYSERLAAGVERVGISNFVSFLTHTEDYRRDLRRVEYGDERDPEMRAFLERISPLNQVDRIKRPLLIFQGANDPRVPAGESEQIYRALVAKGVPVWYVLALDEGHGFRKKANSDYAAAATALFLRRFALGE